MMQLVTAWAQPNNIKPVFWLVAFMVSLNLWMLYAARTAKIRARYFATANSVSKLPNSYGSFRIFGLLFGLILSLLRLAVFRLRVAVCSSFAQIRLIVAFCDLATALRPPILFATNPSGFRFIAALLGRFTLGCFIKTIPPSDARRRFLVFLATHLTPAQMSIGIVAVFVEIRKGLTVFTLSTRFHSIAPLSNYTTG